MSQWYEIGAIEEIVLILGKKWVKYKDDEDDGYEEQNETIDKL